VVQYIKNFIKILPYSFLIRNILRNITGHYYSPIPSLKEIEKQQKDIFSKNTPIGIDMNCEKQIEKLRSFSKMHEAIPFYHEKKRIRFNIDNDSFTYDDAPILHYMMRLLRPSKIIEIGCGNSSACMLDTNDLYLDNKVQFTFIDIIFDDLKKMLQNNDYHKIKMLISKVQDVDVSVFEELEENDILFIDSSHVIKTGSDVHTIFFEILPRVKRGVFIHFHDIRYPFQYMKGDIHNRVFWNEAYLLRAFLQYNKSFKIFFWLNYLLNTNMTTVDELSAFLPLKSWADRFNRDTDARERYADAGGSIWLTRV